MRFKYLTLIGIVILGLVIRFWNLDQKPIWLDEILAALLGLGHTYAVAEQKIIPISTLDQMFGYQPTTCAQITETLARQDGHPPIFFCMIHSWLGQLWSWPQTFVWKLRSLPALLGGVAIALIYYLNRLAFNHKAGLMAAVVMAVSPFGIYLAQEARQYSLAVCLILLALICLVTIQKNLSSSNLGFGGNAAVWGAWVTFNAIGFYVHYFFMFAFCAQVLTLLGLFYGQRQTIDRRHWFYFGIAAIAVSIIYLVGLAMVLQQTGSGRGTDWLNFEGNYLAPILRNLAGVITMVILLPVEDQPLVITIGSTILMIVFSGYLSWWTFKGIKPLLNQYPTTLTLLSFTGWAFLINLAIPYLLHKDISVAFRYNFTYFAGICALIGAAIYPPKHWRLSSKWQFVILAGFVSSILVIINLTFVKPYYPEQVARKMLITNDSEPIVISMAYEGVIDIEGMLDIAKGLSYGLAVYKADQKPNIAITFIKQNHTKDNLQNSITNIRKKILNPFHLWLVGNPILENQELAVEVLSENQCQLQSERGFQSFSLMFRLYHCY